jgi:NTP pyrophosphatase (non-canonical NTP hydrolase)
MDFNQYQKASQQTAKYPNMGDNIPYLALGLTEEAGEVAGKIKKLQRDHGIDSVADLTEPLRADLIKELGDVLWYAAQLATELGVDFATVAQTNLDKLQGRRERDVLNGDGDNR